MVRHFAFSYLQLQVLYSTPLCLVHHTLLQHKFWQKGTYEFFPWYFVNIIQASPWAIVGHILALSTISLAGPIIVGCPIILILYTFKKNQRSVPFGCTQHVVELHIYLTSGVTVETASPVGISIAEPGCPSSWAVIGGPLQARASNASASSVTYRLWNNQRQ